MAKRFVLIDRDGTLVLQKDYLSDPEQLQIIHGAEAALGRLQAAGWGICVVTNQSGIGRGYFDEARSKAVHRRLEDMLERFGVELDGIYICPHRPDEKCNCRKPLPGLILQAVATHGFDPRQAWVIGDKEDDVALGRAVGAKSILVRTGYGREYEARTRADLVADDLPAAIDIILGA